MHVVTFVTGSHQWPFMAYDMYSMRHHDKLRFEGISAERSGIPIDADRYLHYYKGYFFDTGVFVLFRDKPAQFTEVMQVLRGRYNKEADLKINGIRVFLQSTNGEKAIGDYR